MSTELANLNIAIGVDTSAISAGLSQINNQFGVIEQSSLRITNSINQGVSKVVAAIDQVVAAIQKIAPAAEQSKGAVGKFLDGFKEGATYAKAFNDYVKSIENLKTIYETVKKIKWKDIIDGAKGAKQAVVEFAGKIPGLWSRFKDGAKIAVSAMGDLARQAPGILDKIKGPLATIGSNITGLAQRALPALRIAVNSAFGPWGLAIAAVAAAVFLIIQNWDKIKPWLEKLWNWIKDTVNRAIEVIKTYFFNFTPLGLIIKNWDKIIDWLAEFWEKIKQKVPAAIKEVLSFFLAFSPLGQIILNWDKIIVWLNEFWEKIKQKVPAAIKEVLKFFLAFSPLGQIILNWDKIMVWLGEFWEKLKQRVSTAIKEVLAFFYNFTPLGQVIKNWDKIKDYFKGLRDNLVNAAQKIYEGIKKWLMDKFGGIIDSIGRAVGKVKGFFQDLHEKLVGHSIVPDMVTGIGKWMSKLEKEAMSLPAEKAAAKVKSAFFQLVDQVVEKLAKLCPALKEQWNKAKEVMKSAGVDETSAKITDALNNALTESNNKILELKKQLAELNGEKKEALDNIVDTVNAGGLAIDKATLKDAQYKKGVDKLTKSLADQAAMQKQVNDQLAAKDADDLLKAQADQLAQVQGEIEIAKNGGDEIAKFNYEVKQGKFASIEAALGAERYQEWLKKMTETMAQTAAAQKELSAITQKSDQTIVQANNEAGESSAQFGETATTANAQVGESLEQLGDKAKDTFTSITDSIKKCIEDGISKLTDALKGDFEQGFKDLMSGHFKLKDFLKKIWTDIQGALKSVWESIVSTFTQALAKMVTEAIMKSKIIQGIFGGLTGGTGGAGSGEVWDEKLPIPMPSSGGATVSSTATAADKLTLSLNTAKTATDQWALSLNPAKNAAVASTDQWALSLNKAKVATDEWALSLDPAKTAPTTNTTTTTGAKGANAWGMLAAGIGGGLVGGAIGGDAGAAYGSQLASMGAMFGPWGAVAGAVLGGIIGSNSGHNTESEWRVNYLGGQAKQEAATQPGSTLESTQFDYDLAAPSVDTGRVSSAVAAAGSSYTSPEVKSVNIDQPQIVIQAQDIGGPTERKRIAGELWKEIKKVAAGDNRRFGASMVAT